MKPHINYVVLFICKEKPVKKKKISYTDLAIRVIVYTRCLITINGLFASC